MHALCCTRWLESEGATRKKTGKTEYTTREKIKIRWTCEFGSIREVQESDVYVGNLVLRGAPVPGGWLTAFRALNLPAIAERATRDAIYPDNIQRAVCRFLGAAKPVRLPSGNSDKFVVGAAYGPGNSHVLCAEVQGTRWLMYPRTAL